MCAWGGRASGARKGANTQKKCVFTYIGETMICSHDDKDTIKHHVPSGGKINKKIKNTIK